MRSRARRYTIIIEITLIFCVQNTNAYHIPLFIISCIRHRWKFAYQTLTISNSFMELFLYHIRIRTPANHVSCDHIAYHVATIPSSSILSAITDFTMYSYMRFIRYIRCIVILLIMKMKNPKIHQVPCDTIPKSRYTVQFHFSLNILSIRITWTAVINWHKNIHYFHVQY